MNLTDYVVGGTVILLLIYEAYTLANSKPNDTISESIWRASTNRPIVPFVGGLLCGHFFW